MCQCTRCCHHIYRSTLVDKSLCVGITHCFSVNSVLWIAVPQYASPLYGNEGSVVINKIKYPIKECMIMKTIAPIHHCNEWNIQGLLTHTDT